MKELIGGVQETGNSMSPSTLTWFVCSGKITSAVCRAPPYRDTRDEQTLGATHSHTIALEMPQLQAQELPTTTTLTCPALQCSASKPEQKNPNNKTNQEITAKPGKINPRETLTQETDNHEQPLSCKTQLALDSYSRMDVMPLRALVLPWYLIHSA